MLKVLFGSFKITSKFDYVLIPLKVLYLLYNVPFLLVALLMTIRSLGAFGNPLKEEFGLIKKILLHFSAIVTSFFFWIMHIAILKDKYGLNIKIHLF